MPAKTLTLAVKLDEETTKLLREFCRQLRGVNPRFDEERFKRDCGW
jgi:hypothetical protein